MGGGGPNLREDRRIEGRPIRDHFLRTDPGFLEPVQKGGHSLAIHRPIHQLIADQAIAGWGCRIDSEQEGKGTLVHLIDAENAGELLNDPGQVACLIV